MTANGNAVLSLAVRAALEEFADSLSAAFALGSLAHGGFAPLVSDVDIALVLGELDDATPERVARVNRVVRAGSPDPLAERLSVFWTDWPGARFGASGRGRLPSVDRLDLIESGRLLHGVDQRAGALVPDRSTMVREAAQFALQRFGQGYLDALRRPEELLAQGPRGVTKAVLFPVRFLYTLDTGRIGHNEHAARWYDGEQPGAEQPGAELVREAMTWRLAGITEPASAGRLLRAHLTTLYRRFFLGYRAVLADAGDTGLADQLGELAERLERET